MTDNEFTKELSNATASMAKHGRHIEVAPHCHIFTYSRDIAVNTSFREIIEEAWEGISHYFTGVYMVFTITSPTKILFGLNPVKPNGLSGLVKATIIKMSLWTSEALEGLYSEFPVRSETDIMRDAFKTSYLKIIASGFTPIIFYRQLQAKAKQQETPLEHN